MQAYTLAKALYALRSRIAHGFSPGDTVFKIDGRSVSMSEAAKLAKDSLRLAISAFKANPQNPDYLEEDKYWLPLHMRQA